MVDYPATRLDGCPAEGDGDADDDLEEVTDRVLSARRRPPEISVRYCFDQFAEAVGGGTKVRHRHVRLATEGEALAR
jgi:hypothetical protein